MGLQVLLTNDDGIDAPGLAACYEELSGVAEITVVAPADGRSGAGRTRSRKAAVREHPWGHALDGTPADCVAFGLREEVQGADLVVSGCNHGPNAGSYVVGRSGTVGAAVEAAFLGTPAVAVSAYHGSDFFTHPPEEYDFGRPARIAARLVERAVEVGAFERASVLNVNAPVDVEDPPVRLTRPYADYDLEVVRDPEAEGDDRTVELKDSVWPDVTGFENPFPDTGAYRERYPADSDRVALLDGAVSVSPLSVTHEPVDDERVRALVEDLEA